MHSASQDSLNFSSDDSAFLEALANVRTPTASASSSQNVASQGRILSQLSSRSQDLVLGAQTTPTYPECKPSDQVSNEQEHQKPNGIPSPPTLTDVPSSPPLITTCGAKYHESQGALPPSPTRQRPAYLDQDMYRAIGFGDWSTFIRNKRRKLKLQEHDLAPELKSDALKGCVIYINGRTDPPYAELRLLIALNGGEHMPYLDQKRPCTHIVASRLTPKKTEEFRKYRVVLPSWIVDSCERGVRADWTRYKCPDTISTTTLPLFANSRPADDGKPSEEGKALASSSFLPSTSWRDPNRIIPSKTSAFGQNQGMQSPMKAYKPKSLKNPATGPSHFSNGDHCIWESDVPITKAVKEPEHDPSQRREDRSLDSKNASGQTKGKQREINSSSEQNSETNLPKQAEPSHLPTNTCVSITEQRDNSQTDYELVDKLPTPSAFVEYVSQGWSSGTDVNELHLDSFDRETGEKPTQPAQGISTERHGPAAGRFDADYDGSSFLADWPALLSPTPPSPKHLSPRNSHRSASFGTTSIAQHETAAQLETAAQHETAATTYDVSAPAAIKDTTNSSDANTTPCNLPTTLKHRSHPSALLLDASWRAQHTAVSAGFVEGFYSASRLHHLSTWKENLQELVSEAVIQSRRSVEPVEVQGARSILHVDFDCFFVTVGLRQFPDFRDKPVAVAHTVCEGNISSTSEIASCNYAARTYGVRNGMSLGRARELCKDIHMIPYTFDAYYRVSLQFYTILLAIADTLQVVSVDEALIDISHVVKQLQNDAMLDLPYDFSERFKQQHDHQRDPIRAFAQALRQIIRQETDCDVSIGIGANILQARLATRQAKPCGVFHLTPEQLPGFLAQLDIGDLWGVGYSLCERFESWLGTRNVGEILLRASSEQLVKHFGPKLGRSLYDKMLGRDTDRLQSTRVRQTIGAHINWGVRLSTQADLHSFVSRVCDEVARRASRLKTIGAHVAIQIMERAPDAPVEAPKFLGHGKCITHHRSDRMRATNDSYAIFHVVWAMVLKLKVPAHEVRGLAVSLGKLAPMGTEYEQPRLPWALPGRRPDCKLAADDIDADKKAKDPHTSEALHAEKPTSLQDSSVLTRLAKDYDHLHNLGDPQNKGTVTTTDLQPVSSPEAVYDAHSSHTTHEAALPPPSFQIPSASQLDVNALEFLPTTMRERIVSAMKARNVQLPTPSLQQVANQLGLDADVLAQLPINVRQEVLGDVLRHESGFQEETMADPLPESGAALAPTSSLVEQHAAVSSPMTPRRRAGFGQRTPVTTPRKSKTPRSARSSRSSRSPGQLRISEYLSPQKAAQTRNGLSHELPTSTNKIEQDAEVFQDEDTEIRLSGDAVFRAAKEVLKPRSPSPIPTHPDETLRSDHKGNNLADVPGVHTSESLIATCRSNGMNLNDGLSTTNDAPLIASQTLRSMSIDIEVFRSLPASVQAEVYAEHLRATEQRNKLRRKQDRIPDRTTAAWRRHAAEAAVLHEAKIRLDAGTYSSDDPVIDASRQCVGEAPGPDVRASLVEVNATTPRAPLHAYLSLDAFRQQISEWIRVCGQSPPRIQDVDYLEKVLMECVTPKELNRFPRLHLVQGVLRWWNYSIGHNAPQEWYEAYDRVSKTLESTIKHKHHSLLVH
ncbi:deoxycytidyl transferase [Malassezia psittaci]|uniref:DNA repair protein REV1 n=1 Tax=Malassezia psittaci TaxID=1821823 RepID=A0AAF0FFR4_9BASI|nr:deoxycytidyl transferase [Malassezia psittaci]